MRIFIGIGSNLGDKRKNIERVIEEIKRLNIIKVKKVSNLYETEPVGGPPQDKFLNGVIEIETSISPKILLALLKTIEEEMGRKPSDVKWGPRQIDLDILLFGDLVIDEFDLKIPHPLMHKRRFVIEPLSEIAPEVIHPVLNKSISELFSALKSNEKQ